MSSYFSSRANAWRTLIHTLGCLTMGLVIVTSVGFAEDEPADEKQEEPKLKELGTRQSANVGREGMWPAPTEEDWKKPCLLRFQRTWDDALAVQKETGKPIMVCINMDGEIASEHYAGVRYRQPEIAEIYEPYVKVIASVYRHTEKDHDEEGNRILCPRFGSVTCGEHIAIEPIIFEKFCDGQRVAPRHIVVDLEGNEREDKYYINDTASVFDMIQTAHRSLPPAKPDIVRGDRPLLERVASRHIDDREAVEKAYREGDADLRRQLLQKALESGKSAQLALLRLAVFGLDSDLSTKAREALTQVDTPMATTLVSDALRVPMSKEERDTLIATLKRLGDGSRLARWLAVMHQGLSGETAPVKVTEWKKVGAGEYASPMIEIEGATLTEHAERKAAVLEANPDDPEPRLELAEAQLALALEARRTYAGNQRLARRFERALLSEARKQASDAAALGAKGYRIDMVQALSSYYAGDRDTAYPLAEAAVKAMPQGDTGWNSMALLTIFAESRWIKIKAAVKAKEDFPPSWLTDIHAAYSVLLKHPHGTESQVVWHYETLRWLGAEYRAEQVLMEGLQRFKQSTRLHERLLDWVLRNRGPRGVEAAYTKLLEGYEDETPMLGFLGNAQLKVAEAYRRTARFSKALSAYENAIDAYEKFLEAYPDTGDEMEATIALALAGKARVAYVVRKDDVALAAMLESFKRSPGSAGTRDGMGITPGETAQMLLYRLKNQKKADEVARLEGALASLDPALLRPDIGLGPGGR